MLARSGATSHAVHGPQRRRNGGSASGASRHQQEGNWSGRRAVSHWSPALLRPSVAAVSTARLRRPACRVRYAPGSRRRPRQPCWSPRQGSPRPAVWTAQRRARHSRGAGWPGRRGGPRRTRPPAPPAWPRPPSGAHPLQHGDPAAAHMQQRPGCQNAPPAGQFRPAAMVPRRHAGRLEPPASLQVVR